jgi:hypothetical protein
LRCKTGESKVFAFGRSDGTWSIRPSTWQKIRRMSVQRWHEALWEDYLCKGNAPPLTVAELLSGLKSGDGLRQWEKRR